MSPVIERRAGFLSFPPVIKFLLIANVAVFLLIKLVGGLTYQGEGQLSSVVTEYFALWPFEINFFPWQLITYQFMHFDFFHLLFNMLALWMFGVEIEHMWGSRKFGTYYILCGIVAGITHLIVTPLLSAKLGPTIGASGSIMGVLLAFGMTFPTRPVLMFPIFFPIPARYFVILYAGLDLMNGLFATNSGIAHFAHLGGALGGFLLIKFGAPLFAWVEKLGGGSRSSGGIGGSGGIGIGREQRSQHDSRESAAAAFREPARDRQAPVALHRIPSAQTPTRFIVDGEPVTQEVIDEILDKISQFGPHSISAHEKRILNEVSKQM